MANIPSVNRLGESACRIGLHRDSFLGRALATATWFEAVACVQPPIHLKRVQAGEKPYCALPLSSALSILSSVVLAPLYAPLTWYNVAHAVLRLVIRHRTMRGCKSKSSNK